MDIRLRGLLLSGLILAFAPCVAHPPSPRSLGAGIALANWEQAMSAYRALPARQAVDILRPLARGNLVMAQWFLADALAVTGQEEEASQWLYTASLGTRMDASLCRMKQAEIVEYRFLQAFDGHFSAVRNVDALRRHGIAQAVWWHRARQDQSADPDWVCQLVALEASNVPRQLVQPQRQWASKRARVLEDYEKQTGMDLSRAPDLLRITPVR